MSFRTPLGRARGLGSAKDGTHHWWMQRVTAVALVPLAIWFVVGVVQHLGADHAAVKAWLSGPVSATLMVLLIAATFHHAALGLQVVIEDYVAREGLRLGLVLAIKFLCYALAGIGVFSVLRLAFA
jgi:succinate dehydrogenase / fumarate reductase, membrane anchor subunit